VLLSSIWCHAQDDRYVVFLKDKNTSATYTATDVISQRAIDRRSKAGFPALTPEDMPVSVEYVTTLRSLGYEVYARSRWFNCILTETDAFEASALAALPFVASVERVAPSVKLSTHGRKGDGEEIGDAASDVHLASLDLDEMHGRGFKGEGILIAVFDAGFTGVNNPLSSAFADVFAEGRLKATYDFVRAWPDVFNQSSHGTRVYSVMGAFQNDTYVGGAYKADYLLFTTEDESSEYRIEEYNWLFAAERADSAGADIINSSLGYSTFDDLSQSYTYADLDGQSTIVTRAAELAAGRGIIVVASAGNEGDDPWHYITAPADGISVIAVGSVTASGTPSTFSSFGPSYDLRTKPDVVAQGSGMPVINSSGNVSYSSGTSFSAPQVSSLVAGLIQAFPDAHPSDIIDAVRFSASKSLTPDVMVGYGTPSFVAAFNYLTAMGQEADYLVYPNPFLSSLFIRMAKPGGPKTVEMFSAEGRLLFSTSFESSWEANEVALELESLAAGLYLLRITGSSGTETVRVVRQ
jgi:hypothetical protein